MNQTAGKEASIYLTCLKPEYLCPDVEVESITDISSGLLRRRGIRGLIWDADNTNCDYRSRQFFNNTIERHFKRLTSDFKSCFASNANPERIKEIEDCFGIPAIPMDIKKTLP